MIEKRIRVYDKTAFFPGALRGSACPTGRAESAPQRGVWVHLAKDTMAWCERGAKHQYLTKINENDRSPPAFFVFWREEAAPQGRNFSPPGNFMLF
jgi:hypothetical protein